VRRIVITHAKGLKAMRATMADILVGPPEFTDLTVADVWTG
jgi:hypothetical protein